MVMKNWRNGLRKKMGCYSVGMTTFRQKKTTATEDDGEQEGAVFWKKIWAWGS